MAKKPSSAGAGKNKEGQDKEAEKDLSVSYNEFKEYEGRLYTGMKIGRGHKWHYDQGVWKETKLTPDMWKMSFGVTKRRAGKAPKGSGVPVGTEYHWYILAHQHVRKLDANSYTTAMTGLKYKLAHKRADKDKWSVSEKGQRNRLIRLLRKLIEQLEMEPEELEKEKAAVKEKAKKTSAKPKKKREPAEVF
ncbi:hypothetical protein EDD80_10875 [Anseongella ginsenosidimutans]|uniref:Uncharacterized protein n=1 Tax=Anseongella ginsenosidimutans TaxID=496056 RepID=A0A4R3KRN8_9SPHI|nr:hypothetical protein [Anseongella ginsenosidimutans]TCS86283.1 hypothetical protein EDD80_10875 [Anseongella ginsenosidimutans]